jgi:hypothetical protein
VANQPEENKGKDASANDWPPQASRPASPRQACSHFQFNNPSTGTRMIPT